MRNIGPGSDRRGGREGGGARGLRLGRLARQPGVGTLIGAKPLPMPGASSSSDFRLAKLVAWREHPLVQELGLA